MTGEDQIQQRQQALIETLRKNGSLHDPALAEAFLAVPRHLFLPNEPLERAYSDIAIAVKTGAEGQWTSSSSQPAIMAIMLEQLDLQPGQNVLEIGAGSGFNAALIAALVGPEGRVTTLDIQPDLVEAAREHLQAAGWDAVEVVTGDGGYGYPPNAPYDRIILTASSGVIPPAWREQLVEGGRLVLPLNLDGPQLAVAFEKRANQLVSLSSSGCGFMALQGAFTGPPQVITPLNEDPKIYISSSVELPVDARAIQDWLARTDEPDVRASGVIVKVWQVMVNLFAWLNLNLPELGMLNADGALPEGISIPTLVYHGMSQERQSRITPILVSSQGAGLLVRRPGETVPFWDWSLPEPEADLPAFEMYVQAVGNDTRSAARLLAAVRAWEQAGRPEASQLQIRALPEGEPFTPAAGEMVLARPWTNFILHYSTRNRE
jgi:protein-L-isoaspartate(D-aspartate) O-methyltransferase